MYQKLIMKLIMGQKERLLALFIELLRKSYEESKEDIARRVIDHLPESMKANATRVEMIAFLDVLKTSIGAIVESAKPLYR